MPYRVVDRYYRQQNFEFFRNYPNPFYSITFHLDATALKRFCRRHGHPVYLSLCYFFTRAMQKVEDFRYRLIDDQIVLYEQIHIGMTVPAPEGLFSFAYFDAHPDTETFFRQAEGQREQGRNEASLVTREQTNYNYFTAIPGLSFTCFAHATPADTSDGAPRVAFGKFFEQGDRLMVPVGMTVNHLFIDGQALGRLGENAEQELAEPS